MQKKQASIIPRSMQQDLAVSQFPNDAAYEIRNMRIVTTGDNTSLCLTNEKGNSLVNLNLDNSTILGYIYVEDYIVAFSKGNKDYIYKIYIDNNNLKSKKLYEGNLNFSLEHPIEGIVNIESDKVKKIYWVDGLNEVRSMNLVDFENGQNLKYKFEITANNITFNDTIKVTKSYEGGLFTAGVIQYAYSYYNLHGHETPLINCSCLNYISYKQGIDNDARVSCSFNITINNFDNSYDYIRIYSIMRTSLDAVPVVKILTDTYIKNQNDSISFIDNGKIGHTIDPMLLLYLGGDKIIAGTLVNKDDTLFLGNIEDHNYALSESERESIQNTLKEELEFVSPTEGKSLKESSYTSYKGNLDLPQDNLLTFKYGENYRIGIQFQFNDGKLSDVVYLKDIINNKHPMYLDSKLYLPYLQLNNVSVLNNSIARARLMYVYPDVENRTRLCQGIVSPTVYEEKSRINKNLYVQPSWLFRDSSYKNKAFIDKEIQSSYDEEDIYVNLEEIKPETQNITFYYWYDSVRNNLTVFYNYKVQKGNEKVKTFTSRNNDEGGYQAACNYLKSFGITQLPSKEEWQRKGQLESKGELKVNASVDPLENIIYKLKDNNGYYIDSSIVTMYSPDIEDIYNTVNSNQLINVEFIGASAISDIYNDYIITSSNSLRDPKETGLIDRDIKGILKSALLWNDVTPDSNPVDQDPYHSWAFRVYIWHRNGSLNADNNGDNKSIDDSKYGGQYSILDKKVFVNVRDTFNTTYFNSNIKDRPFKTHINNYEGFYKIADKYSYRGVINTVNINADKYPIFGTKINKDYGLIGSIENLEEVEVTNNGETIYSNDPVSIKYKTADHIVIDLGKLLPNSKEIIPEGKIDLTPIISSDYYLIVDKLINSISELPRRISEEEFNKQKLYVGYRFFIRDYNYFNGKFVIQEVATAYKDDENIYTITYLSRVVDISTTGTEPNILQIGFTFMLLCKKDNIYYTVKTIENIDDEYGEKAPVLEYTSVKDIIEEIPIDVVIPDKSIYKCDIIRDLGNTQYGGKLTNKDNDSLMSNIKWTPISEFVNINNNSIIAHRGDTYFQKWDCMSTFPYSSEDKNQVIDITSTFIESRINLDGRTDIRGDYSATMNYSKFNSINNIYSQTDNFFAKTNVVLKDNITKYNTGITFSLSKSYNEEIDSWTNIKLVNSISLDGNYGDLSALKVFNNNIYFFQKSAVGLVNFNDRVQINTSDGVPIEISNSGKVQGKTYISNFYGCSNKWSMVNTASGIYFIDDINKSILHFNGQSFIDLSATKQVYSWINKNISHFSWNLANDSVRVLYDKNTSDIYFTNNKEALAFNEQLGVFSSFYSYPDVEWLFTLGENSYQVCKGNIWKLHSGNQYSNFFNKKENYSISIIANPEFQSDKLFDTIEFRTNGIEYFTNWKADSYPFNSLVTTNEYQTAISTTSSLKKKFRTWRWQIGRSNTFSNKFKRDRIRNPWAKITMSGNSENEVRLYDIVVTYYT